jgi:hypothetical protein
MTANPFMSQTEVDTTPPHSTPAPAAAAAGAVAAAAAATAAASAAAAAAAKEINTIRADVRGNVGVNDRANVGANVGDNVGADVGAILGTDAVEAEGGSLMTSTSPDDSMMVESLSLVAESGRALLVAPKLAY